MNIKDELNRLYHAARDHLDDCDNFGWDELPYDRQDVLNVIKRLVDTRVGDDPSPEVYHRLGEVGGLLLGWGVLDRSDGTLFNERNLLDSVSKAIRERYLATNYDCPIHWDDMARAAIEAVRSHHATRP